MTNLNSKIEWTDVTWSPVTGCTKVSPGCDHCYAETFTERFHRKGSFADVKLHHDQLDAPLHWRKPRRVFVNSMADLSGGVEKSRSRIVGLFPQFIGSIHRSVACATGVAHFRVAAVVASPDEGDVR